MYIRTIFILDRIVLVFQSSGIYFNEVNFLHYIFHFTCLLYSFSFPMAFSSLWDSGALMHDACL